MLSRGAIFYLVAPIVELWLAIKIGAAYGAGFTILALLALSALGLNLLRSRGALALSSAMSSVSKGQKVTGDDVAGKGLELFAAFLLFLPGFLSGAVGLVLQIPQVRRLVLPHVSSRLPRFTTTVGGFGPVFRRGDVIDVDGSESGPSNSTTQTELR